jgi:outer membrane lipoprotein SlyB
MMVLADSQTDDWGSVEKLAPGTSISVVKRAARLGCDLVNVTNSELTCDRTIGGYTRTYVFNRAQVRQVRLEAPEDNHLISGVVAGAAVGGLLGFLGGGQSADAEARAYARFYGIPVGGFVGGMIGHAIHRHGVIVYHRGKHY